MSDQVIRNLISYCMLDHSQSYDVCRLNRETVSHIKILDLVSSSVDFYYRRQYSVFTKHWYSLLWD